MIDWEGQALTIAKDIANGRLYTDTDAKRLAKEFIVQLMTKPSPEIFGALLAMRQEHDGNVGAFMSRDSEIILAYFRERGLDV